MYADAVLTMADTTAKRGGRASRQKGNRAERLVVDLAQAAGFAATRVPLSGAAGGKFAGDVTMPLLGADRRVEVKCRARGFSQLYAWPDGNYALVVKRDRDEPLLIMRLRDGLEVAKLAEGKKTS
jgi:Holliday junction resolvase